MYRYKEMNDWTPEQFECWKFVPRWMKRAKRIELDVKLLYGAMAMYADENDQVTIDLGDGTTQTYTLNGHRSTEH